MPTPLRYLSDRSLTQLRKAVRENLDLYRNGSFQGYATEPGWDIPLGIDFDAEALANLDRSQPRPIAPIDLKNSILVGKALAQLTPSLANEERVWVRLAHLEAFEYCKARWIDSAKEAELTDAVLTHMFAPTQTGIRDDHALSRLWWNYQIAKACLPEDIEGALSLILKSADIRSNFVERIWMTSRRNIASAVLRAMRSDVRLTDSEANFRSFMKALNRMGGGIVFEALSDTETDLFVGECVLYSISAAGS